MAKFAAKDSNKNITLSPHGTGKVVVGTGSATATVQSDGNHSLTLETGNATTGTISIVDGANGNILLSPNGTGSVIIDTDVDVDNINIDGNAITSTNSNGNIDLTPNGTGEVNISKVDIDAGTIDGATIAASDITVGSGKTLDVSAGTFTTSTAQKQTISATAFASGTKMLFQQTAAPTGWTKVTSSNDVALRVVSGTVGSGGSVAFETAFASHTPTAYGGSVGTHTIANSEAPDYVRNTAAPSSRRSTTSYGSLGDLHSTLGCGNNNDYTSGGSHTHSFTPATISAINLDVSFVDVIIATKD